MLPLTSALKTAFGPSFGCPSSKAGRSCSEMCLRADSRGHCQRRSCTRLTSQGRGWRSMLGGERTESLMEWSTCSERSMLRMVCADSTPDWSWHQSRSFSTGPSISASSTRLRSRRDSKTLWESFSSLSSRSPVRPVSATRLTLCAEGS